MGRSALRCEADATFVACRTNRRLACTGTHALAPWQLAGVPYEGISRMQTSLKRRHRDRVVRRGLAMIIEVLRSSQTPLVARYPRDYSE